MSSEIETKDFQESSTAQEQDGNKACTQSCSEMSDRFLRVTADFQNYKSRVEKERMQSIQIGQLSVLTKLLSIVDDVDRAIQEAHKKDADHKDWLAGFQLIAKSLHQLLAEYKVKEIDQVTLFDPELHEALVQVDSPTHESGHIVDVMQKGYMIDNRILRPAKVTVAK